MMNNKIDPERIANLCRASGKTELMVEYLESITNGESISSMFHNYPQLWKQISPSPYLNELRRSGIPPQFRNGIMKWCDIFKAWTHKKVYVYSVNDSNMYIAIKLDDTKGWQFYTITG